MASGKMKLNVAFFARHPVNHISLDCAGSDGIDANALLREFERGGLGQSFHSVLRCHVNARLRQSNVSRHALCIHNGAAAGLEHGGNFMSHRI